MAWLSSCHLIKTLIWLTMYQPVAWIVPHTACFISLSAVHFAIISFHLKLSGTTTKKPSKPNNQADGVNIRSIWCCSVSPFPSFSLPNPLSPPTFISISSHSFSSSSICSPVRDTDAVRKVEGFSFFLFFPWDCPPLHPQHIPQARCVCCWPFKGNYDRIMLRGQLWWKKRQHVNGQQTSVESPKSSTQTTISNKVQDVIIIIIQVP